jgi:hypothetical protein
MIYLTNALSQQLTPETLPATVRAALGKPLRRAPALAQMAVLGALACLPVDCRERPTALLWQSTSGPRQETLELLEEVCHDSGEPMPFTFLATVPASAAVHLRPFLPGLRTAMTLPLDSEQEANWGLLLNVATDWLKQGRYEQVLCAHLDHWADSVSGHWLALAASPPAGGRAILRTPTGEPAVPAADISNFPATVSAWLDTPDVQPLRLDSPAAPGLTVEFARI